MTIGTKIRKLRELHRISQPALALELEISQSTLCNIESGTTKKIDYLLVYQLCRLFEVDMHYFIDDRKYSVNQISGSLLNQNIRC
ncbi:MAG: XRE family transcriptional regulator [Chryseobacterium sp.]|nr:MAG: XRE family transcriptional regulator [Chryseobacterium sp.]